MASVKPPNQTIAQLMPYAIHVQLASIPTGLSLPSTHPIMKHWWLHNVYILIQHTIQECTFNVNVFRIKIPHNPDGKRWQAVLATSHISQVGPKCQRSPLHRPVQNPVLRIVRSHPGRLALSLEPIWSVTAFNKRAAHRARIHRAHLGSATHQAWLQAIASDE